MSADATTSQAGSAAVARTRPRKIAPYALLVPASVIVLIAMAYPVVWQLITSMQHFGLAQQFGAAPEWVWFENYVTLFSNPATWLVVARSVAFCLAAATVTMAIGIGLALLMQASSKGVRITLQISLLLA